MNTYGVKDNKYENRNIYKWRKESKENRWNKKDSSYRNINAYTNTLHGSYTAVVMLGIFVGAIMILIFGVSMNIIEKISHSYEKEQETIYIDEK